MTDDHLHTAVTAGLLVLAGTDDGILQSTVDVTRAVFGAEAASIAIYLEDSEELEFRAVSGQGQGVLEGTRFPAARGLAGFALASRQSLAVEDVTRDPRFARDVAERSGYIPTSIMVAPLLIEDEALGVLSLLDRQSRETLSMQELDLLGALATQAAHAVSMLQAGHRVQQALRGEARGTALLAALAQRLERLEPDRQETAVALLSSLVALIG